MKIYTKFGDQGQTQLLGGITLRKSDDRIDLIGTLDELNSNIGLALSCQPQSAIDEHLTAVQRELFEWGAALAGAAPERQRPPSDQAVDRLEQEIDQWQDELPAMTHFILPGGCPCGAALHLARTVCRRTERVCTRLIDEGPNESADDDPLVQLQVYINRLSDWLFVAARLENHCADAGETKWEPGKP